MLLAKLVWNFMANLLLAGVIATYQPICGQKEERIITGK